MMIEATALNLRLCCSRVTIDERTEDYIRKRVAKLDRFFPKIMEINCDVEIHMDKKGKFQAEVMIETPYAKYRVEELSESIEGSVDMAVDRLKVQIVKDKDKLKELKERGARSLKKKIVIDEDARFRK